MRHAVLMAFAVAAVAAPACAADLSVSDGWSRPVAAGASAAGYMVIVNPGPDADVLLSAASPAASRVELHSSGVVDGVMRMRPLAGGKVVPAKGSAVFRPMGDHLMLIGMKRASQAGDRIPVTLTFAKAGVVQTRLEVRATARPAAGHDH